MKNKGIILFDIDRTILDTDNTSVLRNEALAKALNTTDFDKINKSKDAYRATLKNEREYLPEEFLKFLCRDFNHCDENSLLDIYYGDKYSYIYENSVFPETKPTLEQMSRDFRLGVYSEGRTKFQTHKFRSMNLNEYFDNDLIFIFEAKDTKEAINKLPKPAIVIDDKERICEFLTENNIQAIWLNKTDNRKSDRFETIHTLLDLPVKLV